MSLWTGEAMVAAMDGRPVGRMPDDVTGISIDTRSLAPGDAYFAIKGDVHDGHDFATNAVAAGAAVLVVAEAKLPSLGRLQVAMIVVDDVLKALEKLAAAARARARGKIIAVTGSAGKTTTKEALRVALAPSGSVHASDKSFNNHWGVPLSLARLPEGADFGVFEIGMNHPGEIRPLVKLVRPHVALVTVIAAAHLGQFKSLDEIARAKAEIFEGLAEGGTALINRDDPHCKTLEKLAKAAGAVNIVSYGEHLRAKYRLVSVELGAASSQIMARIGNRDISAEIGAPGRHIVQNCLAVLGAADLTGADVGKAASALAGLKAERGRGQKHKLKLPRGSVTLIDESYNANPASMRAALALLAACSDAKRRIAVLGDMLELGEHSEALHAELAGPVTQSGADLVFLAGAQMQALAGALPAKTLGGHFAAAPDLVPILAAALKPGDAVMIKSSNGIGFSKIVDALLKQFPPVKEAA